MIKGLLEKYLKISYHIWLEPEKMSKISKSYKRLFYKRNMKVVAKNLYLGIAAILIGIGLVAIGSHTVTAVNPSLTPFKFKAKECKVDTSPDPVSCKDLKKMLNDRAFIWFLEAHPVGGAFEITLTPAGR
jgi:hypothetical protein